MRILSGLRVGAPPLLFVLLLTTGCRSLNDIGVLVPPTVDEDPNLPSTSVEIHGKTRKIHLKTFGAPDLPVLFVLHGSYTDTRPYANICQGLSDRYRVVIWDQRGCGLSERITEEEFTLESAVEEIEQIKKQFSPDKKVTIVGQSWGGGLATLYTSTHPENVEQLALIEPMPLKGSDMQELFNKIVEFRYENPSWNAMVRHGRAIGPGDHARLDYRAMMILRSTMTSGYHCDAQNPPAWPIHRVGAFLEYVRNKRLGNPISGFSYDFTRGLDAFQDTVLILGGSCSALGYEMQKRYSQAHFPRARVVEIPNAGHRMNIEKFDEVMANFKAFLKQYRR